jgi:hypothetical protein
MARPRNTTQSRKIEPTIPGDAFACLEHLARMGRYGGNPSEVARYILLRGLDDLTRAGVLPALPPEAE